MSDDITISVSGEEYVLDKGDDGLELGRRVNGEITWLDTIDLGLLPPDARSALDRGDTSDEALLTALRGVIQAEVERGG
jgi:hypothetical protein